MSYVPLHMRRHPSCDCGACCDGCGDHTSACMSGLGVIPNIAEEVALTDGYSYPPRRISQHKKPTIRLPSVDENTNQA